MTAIDYTQEAAAYLRALGALAIHEGHRPRFYLATRAGTAHVTVFETWIAIQFDNVGLARSVLGAHHLFGVGPSGKWNFRPTTPSARDGYGPPSLDAYMAAFREYMHRVLFPTLTETSRETFESAQDAVNGAFSELDPDVLVSMQATTNDEDDFRVTVVRYRRA
jgi:hypothetical protein